MATVVLGVKPVDGLQVYVYGLVPPVAVGLPPIRTLSPPQVTNETSGPAFAEGFGFTVIIAEPVINVVQPKELVPLTVYVPAVV